MSNKENYKKLNEESKKCNEISGDDTATNIVSYKENKATSPLEEEYTRLYGEEFVNDLKSAYRWMRYDVRKYSRDEVKERRKQRGDEYVGKTYVYVNFADQEVHEMTVDECGEKTVYNIGFSEYMLRTDEDRHLRLLLAGMLQYDEDKANKWISELLGPGEDVWALDEIVRWKGEDHDRYFAAKEKLEKKKEEKRIARESGMSELNTINISEEKEQSPLEKDYIDCYGKEFVEDLNWAYRWMRRDVESQPLTKEEIVKNRSKFTTMGHAESFFFVDMYNMDMYTMTVDDDGGKTIYNYGCSPTLRIANNKNNIRFLLSGIMIYDVDKAKKWLDELLEPGALIWYERL